VPTGVPPALLQRLERDVMAAIGDADTSRRAREAGFQVLGWDSARSQRFVQEETARWATLVTEAQIRPDA
jgi:tripartite-type tricarboxylate transporter receptor subunit TctC